MLRVEVPRIHKSLSSEGVGGDREGKYLLTTGVAGDPTDGHALRVYLLHLARTLSLLLILRPPWSANERRVTWDH